MLTSHKQKQPVIFIGGATASGKSRLALLLAEAFDAVIINADSMQVFKELPILTAQPTSAEQCQTPHRLYSIVSGDTATSVSFWLSKAQRAIDEVHEQGKMPILVGGTGLYFEALEQGLSSIPPVSSVLKDVLQKRVMQHGLINLYEELRQVDPCCARRIEPMDSQRIVRALSVFQSTGVTLSKWQEQKNLRPRGYSYFSIWLDPPRPIILERLTQRCHRMFAGGAIEEVRTLLAKTYVPDVTIHKAIGVSQIQQYLKGATSFESAIEATIIASRQYAKRQKTWFRHRFKADVILADIPQDIGQIVQPCFRKFDLRKNFSLISTDPIDEMF